MKQYIRYLFTLMTTFSTLNACVKSPSLSSYYKISPHTPFTLIKEGTDQIHPKLIQLGQILGLDIPSNIKDANNVLQNNWKRDPGKERHETSEIEVSAEQKEKALFIIKDLGFLDADTLDTPTHPKYFLLFGGMIFRIKSRINNMVELISSKQVTPENIIMLGGANRFLRTEELEEVADILDSTFLKRVNIETKDQMSEAHLIRLIWEKGSSIPQSIKKHYTEEKGNLTFINSTISEHGEGRATTKGTIDSWMANTPEPGLCYMNVEKPYAPRMRNVLFLSLQKQNAEITTGPKFSLLYNSEKSATNLNLSIYLDSITRALYQEIAIYNYLNKK